MSSIDEGFSSGSRMTAAAIVGRAGMDEIARVGSKQAFFEGVGLIVMDSDKRLHCLSQNSALKLEAISFSSSSSQIIGGTSRLTPVSSSSLQDEEDEDDETDEEDKDVGSRVLALWTERVLGFFFF